MTSAARHPEIPPAPFAKGVDGLLLKPLFAFLPSAPLFPFPSLKKRGQGGFAPGFTLVEVIVTIIAAAILGAIFTTFMGTALSKSSRSIEYVQGEASAEATLERILADYVYEINRDPVNALVTLQTQAGSPTFKYGSNVNMQFITYVISGPTANENILTSGTSDTLKVTVTAPGNDLTTLLTRSRLAGSPAAAF
jgi:prepilin-type N-terminal cleavage/methylation domain-containing protein